MSLTHKECNDILWNKYDDTQYYCFKKDIDDIWNQLPTMTVNGTKKTVTFRLISNPFSTQEDWLTHARFIYDRNLKRWTNTITGKGTLIIVEEDEFLPTFYVQNMKVDLYRRDSNGLAANLWKEHRKEADVYFVSKIYLDEVLTDSYVKTDKNGRNALPHPTVDGSYIYSDYFEYERLPNGNRWVYKDLKLGILCYIYED